MTEEEWMRQLFERLLRSKFRSRFHLKDKEKEYVREKGMEEIRAHASEFIERRIAPEKISNDGKQTPMRVTRYSLLSMPRPLAAEDVSKSGIK